jgi:hypothetical protein
VSDRRAAIAALGEELRRDFENLASAFGRVVGCSGMWLPPLVAEWEPDGGIGSSLVRRPGEPV